MKSIVDIPDSALLSTSTPTDLVGEITSLIGLDKPDVVCVPMIDFGGANYRSRIIDRNVGHWSGYDLVSIVKEIRQRFAAKVYLSIIPSMPFLDAHPFTIRDQYGDDKTGVCIVNPHIQRVLQDAIQETVELLQPDGIVLDICDINGQNAVSGRIELTCFCSYCIEALHEATRFDYSVMRSHPNPVNLVLKDTGDSIKHFPINLQTMTESELVALSQTNGIFNREWIETDEKAKEWARQILDYIRARSLVTAEAVRSIGKEIRKTGARMVTIIDHPRFAWTSGVDLDHLQGCVDEVWTETSDLREGEIPSDIEVYHYLFSRSRYFIAAYFELASNRDRLEAIAAGFTSAKMSVRDLLQDRSKKLLNSSEVKRANVSAIQAMGAFAGYVAPAVTAKVMQRINDRALQIVPEAEEAKTAAGAADVLVLLMQLAERGTPITMDILRQVAQRLGVFAS